MEKVFCCPVCGLCSLGRMRNAPSMRTLFSMSSASCRESLVWNHGFPRWLFCWGTGSPRICSKVGLFKGFVCEECGERQGREGGRREEGRREEEKEEERKEMGVCYVGNSSKKILCHVLRLFTHSLLSFLDRFMERVLFSFLLPPSSPPPLPCNRR